MGDREHLGEGLPGNLMAALLASGSTAAVVPRDPGRDEPRRVPDKDE